VQEEARLTIVIPAYDEADTIAEVVAKARSVRTPVEVLVVDDGSTDETARIAAEAGARVVRHPYNKGNGAAVKTGLRQASGDFVLLMDADGQHDPADIEQLLSFIGEYDLVVGARDARAESAWLRRLGNGFLNWLASYLIGMNIPDLTSGFRAVKRDLLMEFIHLLPNGFSYPTTSTLAFIKAGYSVKFVPLKMHRRGGGKSKIQLWQDGGKFMLIILRMTTLFNPLKVFFPMSVVLFILGAGYAVATIIAQMHVTNSSVLLITMSIIVFLMGLMSEQIAALRFERKE
jgi:glycosyltransferase involved in cell wall biosynthesis